jgi:hypothetical protein
MLGTWGLVSSLLIVAVNGAFFGESKPSDQ